MTSSIPDSISSDALEAFAESAKSNEKLSQEMTISEMNELVIKDIEDLTDKFGTIFGYKLVAHYSLYKLLEKHNATHGQACEQGEYDNALLFGRDAGWLQLMLKGLTDIQCGHQDFMCPMSEEDNE